ncbi:hypothetical protein SAMN06295885_2405 [Rathayibacter oskolensis]|uniref:Uncharacterized protein n=1 Tax=Rathayibacter oskolensis TaxID=1891671 RepID=A0A1X7P3A5_9MICO|nr:hypothetical protein [Rathayibacter oskolensis]SMH44684.1 hypothetical protein SAMN06295885_2405 [Rathayibacter oskolensis]
MRSSGRLDDDGFAALLAEQVARIRATFGDLPVWAIEGWTGERLVSEWIFEGGPHCLAFARSGAALDEDPAVTTRTCLGEPRQDIAGLLGRDALPRPGLLPAPSRITEIEVDGAREPFEVWEAPGVARAAASVRGHSLTLECRGLPLDELVLSEVVDIEPFVEGRLAMIAASRG